MSDILVVLHRELENKTVQPGYSLQELAADFRHGCDTTICGKFRSDRPTAALASIALDKGNHVLRIAEKRGSASAAGPAVSGPAASAAAFWQQPPDVGHLLRLKVHSTGCLLPDETRGGKRRVLPIQSYQDEGGSKRARTTGASKGCKSKAKTTAGAVWSAAPELSETLQCSMAYILEVLAAAQFAGGQVEFFDKGYQFSWIQI